MRSLRRHDPDQVQSPRRREAPAGVDSCGRRPLCRPLSPVRRTPALTYPDYKVTTMERVIVAGGGLAAVRTVEALRAQGHAGRLTLVGAEPHRPYDRPPLSKAVLRGETDDTTIDADWAALDCEPLLGHRATGLGEALETTAGPLDFDGLVIATGATPIRLPG